MESKIDSFTFYLFPFYFFTPSFAGITPSRFIGLFLSFRPPRPSAPLAYPNFSAHLITGLETLDKNFFKVKSGGWSGLVEFFQERFDSFAHIPCGYDG